MSIGKTEVQTRVRTGAMRVEKVFKAWAEMARN
jgi:hypothetical protein